MKRNIYIVDEDYDSIKKQSKLENRTIANYLVWLHYRYLQDTSRKITGKTLSQQAVAGSKVLPDPLGVGRQGDVGNVAKAGSEVVYAVKDAGGVIRVSMAELEKISPEFAKKVRELGPDAPDSTVEVELPDDCSHEVMEFDETLNADICMNCGSVFYRQKPDVADVVKADEDAAKETAIKNIKKDLDNIVHKAVRPYPKDKQLGKGRKK